MATAPRARAAPTLPKQSDRASQDLATAADGQSRSHRATADHLRGEGKQVAVSLEAGDTKTIRHGLGRRPKGWQLLSLRAADPVDAYPRETSRDTSTITIAWDGSGAVSFDLFVF